MAIQPPASLKLKKKFWQKRIPTLVGIGILLIALVSGMLMFSQGTGVFAPRATPQTTPKKIHITNITDSGFTVSFFTDEATSAFIKYGTDADELKSQASDDRDQLSGSIGKYSVHHITVRGLEPNTPYFYTLGTGSGAQFDNSGSPFTTKTAPKGGVPPAARTIYGSVVTEAGSPAEGTVVYAVIEGVGELSSLVKSSGSWAIPLSTARTTAGNEYAPITDETVITLLAQGDSANTTSQVTTTVSAAQPVSTITLGQSANTTAQTQETGGETTSNTGTGSNTGDSLTASGSAYAMVDTDLNTTPSSSTSSDSRGGLGNLLTTGLTNSNASQSASTSAVLDLATVEASPEAKPIITSTQPVITGKAIPNVVVTIEVNSDTQINAQLTTDAKGNFVLDIAKLSQQLEPGEHTVTYSYVDPTTGKTVTKTETFTVNPAAGSTSQSSSAQSGSGGTSGASTSGAGATSGSGSSSSGSGGSGGQLAQATSKTSPSPYGSGNPYPLGGATQSGKTATSSGTATKSGTRVSIPSTSSGIPVSGSVGTTMALVAGGLFFLIAGGWSYWIAQQLEEDLA